jgi:hypothetical protein
LEKEKRRKQLRVTLEALKELLDQSVNKVIDI